MGFVTIQAIFRHRCVFPDEGSPFIGMAAVTKLIYRIRREQGIGCGTMRIVTIGAIELAFEQGHMGTLFELQALPSVAAKTRFIDVRLA